MQSRRTLTLTLSLLRREGTFGGTVSGSPNKGYETGAHFLSPLGAGGDQGEGHFRLHTYD